MPTKVRLQKYQKVPPICKWSCGIGELATSAGPGMEISLVTLRNPLAKGLEDHQYKVPTSLTFTILMSIIKRYSMRYTG